MFPEIVMAEKDSSTRSIAVIDDDHSTLRLLEWTLSHSWGYRVSTYSSVSECFADVNVIPQLVLLAVSSEQNDVAVVCETLRERWPKVSVILLTVHGEHDAAARALRKGAWDYFDKPLDLRRLQHSMQQAIRVRRLELLNVRRVKRRSSGKRGVQDVQDHDELQTMDQVKARALVAALKRSGGNIKEAARQLEIGRTTMYKLMARYGIDHHAAEMHIDL
jgi:DNA-binding NtrC family response regulator